jgi:thiamine transport system permease protein
MRWVSRDLGFLLPLLVFVAGFALIPVAVLFAQAWSSAGGVSAFVAVLQDPLNQAAITNSLVQGALSAIGAVVIGYPAGVFLGRYHWRGREFLRAYLLLPFLLPVLVMVAGIVELFGPGGWVTLGLPVAARLGSGLGGIVVLNLAFNVPVVILFTAVATESASVDLEETASLLGAPPARVYRDVWGPPSWRGAAAGGILSFIFSALAFAGPLVLCGPRCYTIEARVWFLDKTISAPTDAALLGLAMVAIMILPVALFLRGGVRAGALATGGRAPSRPVPWGSPVAKALAIETSLVVVFESVLIVTVLVRSVFPDGWSTPSTLGWSELFGPAVSAAVGVSTYGALANSLVFAAVVSGLTLLLGVAALFTLRRHPSGAGRVRLLVFVPLVISPILLAFALFSFWRPIFGSPSLVWGLIIASQMLIALPFVLEGLAVSSRSVPDGPREAAELLGARPFAAYLDADLPALRAGLLTACLFAAVVSLGEFTATYFLVVPAFTTLPVELYDLPSHRLAGASGALAALLVLVSAAIVIGLAWGGRRASA